MIDSKALSTALTRLKAFRSASSVGALIHQPSGLTATDLDVAIKELENSAARR
ncbi:hypothetical protein [Sphingomonas endolithica]|uniref:hypothetical protein n=1 Tax=Sphingomonas endolithica TaxID=2972485 RepID=UPI0021AF3D74|nr:hypothetical protein [Sphingomonas sp. ZFBP2030]